MKRVAVDGDAREADEVFCVGDSMSGSPYKIKVWRPRIEELSKYMPIRDLTENTNELRTPMPGKVHSIAVKGQRTLFPGQLHMQDVAVFEDIVGRALTQEAFSVCVCAVGEDVLAGQELCVVEAMKMQNVLRAPKVCFHPHLLPSTSLARP